MVYSLLNVVSFVQLTLEKRCVLDKTCFCYYTETNIATLIVHTDIVKVDLSPGGGKLSPFSCLGTGNKPLSNKKNV